MGEIINIKKSPVFSEKLKERMEDNLQKHTDHPKDAVETVEDTICQHMVLTAKEFGANLAEKLFARIFG